MAVPLVKTFWKRFSTFTGQSHYTNHYLSRVADSTVPKLATDLLISNATAVGTKINSYVTGNWDHGTVMSSNVDNIVGNVQTLLSAQ